MGAFARGWRLGPEAWAVLGRSSRPSRGETEEESCSVGSCTSHLPRVPAHPWPAPLPSLRPRALLHASRPAASLASNPRQHRVLGFRLPLVVHFVAHFRITKHQRARNTAAVFAKRHPFRLFVPFPREKKKKPWRRHPRRSGSLQLAPSFSDSSFSPLAALCPPSP